MQDRFNQPGYAMYQNLEDLLLQALSGADFSGTMQQVTGLYHEPDASTLEVQLKTLASHFKNRSTHGSTIKECIQYLRGLSAEAVVLQ